MFIDAAVRAWFTIELVAGRARCERVGGLFYASSPMGLEAVLRITGCEQKWLVASRSGVRIAEPAI